MRERRDEEPIVIELNPRERRLYDRLRAVVIAPRVRSNSGFGDLLLFLPDTVVLLTRLMRDDRRADSCEGRRALRCGICALANRPAA